MAIAFSAPSLTDVLQPAFRQFVPLARGLAAALGENPRKVPGYCPRRALGEIGRAFKAPTRSATARVAGSRMLRRAALFSNSDFTGLRWREQPMNPGSGS